MRSPPSPRLGQAAPLPPVGAGCARGRPPRQPEPRGVALARRSGQSSRTSRHTGEVGAAARVREAGAVGFVGAEGGGAGSAGIGAGAEAVAGRTHRPKGSSSAWSSPAAARGGSRRPWHAMVVGRSCMRRLAGVGADRQMLAGVGQTGRCSPGEGEWASGDGGLVGDDSATGGATFLSSRYGVDLE